MSNRALLYRLRPLFLWVGAIGFGVLGVVGTRGYISESLQSERERLSQAQRTVATVVAKHDLDAGEVVGPESMSIRQMPEKYLPRSAVLADDFPQFVGARLSVPMSSGQSLLRSVMRSHQKGFSNQVGHGIRAMTILVDEVNSVSGMLAPGDRIDLLFSTRPPNKAGEASEVTAPLMQDLLVLATGTKTTPDPERRQDPFASITVQVSPNQAQRLVLAQRSGRLTALLRNPDDRRAHFAKPMDVYGLLGLTRPADKRALTLGPKMIVGGLGPIRIENGVLQVKQ